jgi:hypothetical protein
MQDHLDETTFDTHDDLVESRAKDPFTRPGSRGRMGPRQLKIGAELHRGLSLPLTQCRRFFRLECRDLAFDSVNRLQRLIPTPLQLRGDQPIVGVHRIILPARMGSLVRPSPPISGHAGSDHT